ncbi:sensor histidine kinase [Edaphobacter flagellatus]|uniref:sensor histidine kinase n=1 Tax=Edaphobacter flagellatus TaxID=1933044 RepID=UPI0021B302AA|nr:ATP-binding protein [Edaphobacter flagellatus]
MTKRTIREGTTRIAVGIAVGLSITWLAYRFHFNLASATSIHLFLVTAIALRWGLLEASIVSLVSVACLDYFFTQPLFQFYMTDSHDWVALVTFESVALLVSRLSNQVSRHAREVEIHQLQLQKLYELSQNILLLDQQKLVDQQLADLILATLQAKGVALWNDYDLHLSKSGTCEVTDDEVRSTYFSERNEDDPLTATSRRVLRSGTRAIGSLVICGHSLDDASIIATASLTAVAIERARSFSAESSAEAARQSEQLRSAVLDGLAHAFKTPLTTIRSSSSGLLEMDTLSGAEKRLVALIDQQADHLNDLTTRLLRTARIDTVDLKLKREAIDLTQLLQSSAEASTQDLGAHPIRLLAGTKHSTVWADRQLLEMALFQLLDNAAKYGSSESSITIDVQEDPAETLISIKNEGSFIPPHERENIFKRFYRSPGSDRKAPGTGIGLSVVKRIAEAHQGRAWVNSGEHTGTTFFLSLPRTAKEM